MVTYLRSSIILVIFVVSTTLSCTSTVALTPVTHSYSRADFTGAYEKLQDLKTEYVKKQGPLLYALDAGLLAHYDNQWLPSNTYLDEAERRIWERYTESLSGNIASYLINENTRPYQGEDYEDLYTNLFKALNYAHLGDSEGALVELRRFNEKQQMLKQKYDTLHKAMDKTTGGIKSNYSKGISIQFSTSALGNYLQMVLARDTGDKDQAQFAQSNVQQAFKKQPSLYPFFPPRTLEEDLVPPSNNKKRVNIVAFTGLGPYKEEVVERVWFSYDNYMKIALPQMVLRPTRVRSIDVHLSDGSKFKLEPIEDMGAIAQEAFHLKRSYIESKTIIRSFLKSAGTEIIDATTASMAREAKDADEAEAIHFFGSLISFASRIFNEASERADTRGSHFFPDRAWVGGITLPLGRYDARVLYRDRNGKIIHEQNLENLEVTPDNLKLWESVCPL